MFDKYKKSSLCKLGKVKINWEALTVIVAMITLIVQILWSMYTDYDKKKDDKVKLRTMYAYEIKSNSKQLCLVYETRNINSRYEDYELDEDLSVDLYGYGRVKLRLLSNLQNKVFSSYFTQMQILDTDEIADLMHYYQNLDDLKIQVKKSSSQISRPHSIEDIDSESYKVSTLFKEQMQLSQQLINRYKNIAPQLAGVGGSCHESEKK